MKRFWAIFIVRIKLLIRDRSSLFFAFAFPLMLVLFFGMVLTRDNDISLHISVYQNTSNPLVQPVYDILQQAKMFEVTYETDLSAAQEAVRVGRKDYILVLNDSDNGGVEIEVQYGLRGLSNYETVIEPILYGVVQQANYQPLVQEVMSHASSYQLNQTQLYSLEDTILSDSQVNTVVAGMNGWILQAMVFFTVIGMARIVAEDKQLTILKRFAVTGLRRWEYLMATVLSFVLMSLLQLGVLIGVATLAFHLTFYNLPLVVLAAIVISLLMASLGLLIGVLSPTVSTAISLSQLFIFPLIILAGAWFPLWLFPDWLQRMARFSPFTQAKNLLDQIAAVSVPEVQLITMITLVISLIVLGGCSLRWFRFERS